MNAVFRLPVSPLSWGFLFLFLLLPLAATAQDKAIRLRNETILTPPAPPPGARRPALQDAANVSGLYLIQFQNRYQPEFANELTALGVRLAVYVPEDTFIARLQNASLERIRSLPFVRWVGEFKPNHKLHSAIADWAANPGGEASRTLNLMISPAASPIERALVRRLLQRLDRQAQGRFGGLLQGSVLRTQLGALAASPAILWVEPAPNPKLVDEVAAKIVAGDGGAGRLAMQELGFDGTGVTVSVADSGLDTGDLETMHPDIAGRVAGLFFYGNLEDASDGHSHGTHVTGIVAGNAAVGETDENGFLYGLGVAPGATVVAQRLFDDAGGYEAPPSFETLTRDAVRAGADIGSNSWGDDVQGRYDISAAEFDALVRDADSLSAGDQEYILEFSAGNAGPGAQTIGSPAVAKNVIATGASQNDRLDLFLYADGIEAMADFSSRGPCEDGRIKPDVVAPGTWIASMKSQFAPDDNAWAVISADYIYQGGTSQAGPQVSGAAAVFVQYYKQQFGRKPSPALVKAALINSSVDMDNESGTTSVPNMDEGWGRVDLTRLIGSEFRLYDMTDQSSLLGANQVFEKRIVVLNGDEELKVTMAYTDVPGFPGAIPVLVNDLDLEVTDPDGVLYRGNRFEDGQSVPNLPTGDRVNNVEGVHLYDPKPGEYVVRVRGINVVQDSRRDTPRVDQDFALVISGSVPAPGVAAIFLDRPAYRSPATVRVSVLDPQKAGQPTVTARVQTQTEPSGEVITLRAAASSILFTGMVSMISGPAQPDGVLQASHGNTLTASYTSSGGEIVRTSRVDFLPPQISNVTTAADLGGVTVTWTTDEPASSLVVYGQGTPSLVSSNRAVGTSASVDLVDLVADRAYVYYVVAIDEAGNHRTNNNNGSFFPFTSPRGKTVLLVNAYVRDNLLDTDFIPLSTYTTALDAARISYDVWEKSSRPPLRLENLKPYRALIWRINDMDFAASLSASEFSILTNYVSSGGGFFMASMEGLSRFANPSFNSQLANISSFVEDVGANPVIGISGDPVSSGLEIALNYSNYPDFSDIGFGGPDFSDHLVPGTNAAPVFLDGVSSEVVGVRSPRALKSNRGRTVFLAFPLDAAPAAANGSGLRSQLLRNAIAYLAPGADGLGSLVLDNSRYTLPALVEVEAGDADLAGQSSLVVHASSTFDPAGISITLAAASGKGVFQGSFILVPDTQAAGPGRLRARHGDEITVRYTDASSQSTVSVLAVVDTEKPVVTSGPSAEPDYTEAVISWTTSKPTDSLVEFGETVRLGRTAYAAAMNTSHELTLPGLSADRSYFYKVTSRDQAGNAVEHDNNGRMHQLRTLTPRPVPWSDDMNSGQGEWTVFSPDESLAEWQLGVPRNGLVNAAHSPPHAWGTSLNGGVQDQVETFLISPAMNLAGGNVATLRFWHSYDFLQSEFDIINGGEVLIITNSAAQYATVAEYGDARFGWTEEEIDLTPFIGNVVYVAFHNVLFSFDTEPRPGWVVDDVAVDISTRAPSTIEVFCSLQHARFALVGPRGKSGQGVSYTDTNALPGNYSIAFGSVPFYTTPSGQAQTLPEGQKIRFEGIYTFPDTNQNGVSDLWEQHHFGNLQPRPGSEDQDADGSTLLSEFHAGTDPRDAASNLRLLSPTPQANGALLLSWTSVADRGYRLWHSKDLIQWEPSGDWMNGRAETTSTTIPPSLANSAAFWRVEVRP